MLKQKGMALLLTGTLLGTGVSYADFVDGVVGGIVGGVTGSVITNEIYRHNAQKRRHVRRTVHRTRHHRTVHRTRKAPVRRPVAIMTPEKKIQKALKALGFYRGPIDGAINAYETRSAIKAMNQAYERGESASLDSTARDTLIYLGDLFTLDRYLTARATDRRTRNKKLQAALKIHGTYHGKIDGAVGPATRRAIAEYTGGVTTLDFEEEYRLIESAKKKNDRNIDDAVATLKGRTHRQTRPLGHTAAPAPEANNTPIVLQPTN
jgi:hypothetical protein